MPPTPFSNTVLVSFNTEAAALLDSDTHARYAFARQSDIALFNLSRFAQPLLPLFGDPPHTAAELAKQHLSAFKPVFLSQYTHLKKTGI